MKDLEGPRRTIKNDRQGIKLIALARQILAGVNKFDDQLLGSRPFLWAARPASVTLILLLVTLISLVLGISLRGDSSLMKDLDATSLAESRVSYWQRVCMAEEQQSQVQACLQQEFPGQLPEEIVELQNVASEHSMSLQQLVTTFENHLNTHGYALAVSGITLFILSCFLLELPRSARVYSYRTNPGLSLFATYYLQALSFLLPFYLLLWILVPYRATFSEAIIDLRMSPIMLNLALWGGLAGQLNLTLKKPRNANELPNIKLDTHGSLLIGHFILGVFAWIFLMFVTAEEPTEFAISMRQFGWLYLTAYSLMMIVIPAIYGIRGKRRIVFFDQAGTIAFLASGFSICVYPAIYLYRNQENLGDDLMIYSLLFVLASLLLGILLSLVVQFYTNRVLAFPR